MERVGRQFESAPATEADIADVFKLGKGIGRLGQGIGAALSVGPPSSAADVSVAVPEFNFLTRLSMPVPPLNAAANAKAVQWNGRHHPATSGVDPANIRTDVARYVNLTAIATAIQNFNAANPTKAIQLGTPPMDAVLVEGIHQFQAKCFFETSQIDGMAGESTLDSLGLVKRSGMNSVDQRNTGAHARLGKVDVARLTSNEFTADTWFDHMVNPSFLGWRFLTGGTPRGVHLSFMRKLRIAERALLAQSKFSGKTPVELGKALGFNATSEEHKGARPTVTSASMHTYGLAVDIKYTGNPWVRGADFLAALKRSALLMSGVQITQRTSQRFLHDLGSDATRTTAAIFDILAQRNRDFRDYLALSANAAGLTAVLQRRRAEGTAGVFAAATESIADAAQRWRTNIQTDLRNMRAKESPFRSGATRDPLLGFLNLDRDLVIALRDTACLAWGAVDIGPGREPDRDQGSGDMMHFDDRVCGIGQALVPVGGNFPPKSGHPCVACGPPAASHQEPEAFNGGDFETERLEEAYDPPMPHPDVSSYEDPIPYAEPTISTESAPRPVSALSDPGVQPFASGELGGPRGGSARALTAPSRCTDGSKPIEDWEFVRYIPSIMRAQSPPWEKAAALMERWLRGPARQLRGDSRLGNATDGGLLDIDNTITMDWVLQYGRAREKYNELIAPGNFRDPAVMAQVIRYAKAELDKSGTNNTSFGVSQPSNDRDRDSMRCDSRAVGSYFRDPLDDLSGALARFTVNVIPGGTVTQKSIRTPGQAPQSPDDSRIDITVTQASVYVRDSYDFNGDQSLGYWERPDRVYKIIMYGDARAAMAALAYRRQGHYCPGDVVEVTNEVFRKYRDRTKMGQDFSVYSDLKVATLAFPVYIHAIGNQGSWSDPIHVNPFAPAGGW